MWLESSRTIRCPLVVWVCAVGSLRRVRSGESNSQLLPTCKRNALLGHTSHVSQWRIPCRVLPSEDRSTGNCHHAEHKPRIPTFRFVWIFPCNFLFSVQVISLNMGKCAPMLEMKQHKNEY